jgi:hypothetical protein
MSETPFKLSVSDERLDLLKRKLSLSRLPDELEDAGWDYGAPLTDLQRLLNHWKDNYDWRATESAINTELPMFSRGVEVDGHGRLEVHYV